MPLAETWLKIWIYLGCVCGWSRGARPQFDTSTDMGLVLVPADAEVDSVIFRLRATDEDADFPLVFDVSAAVSPIVRIENLPCTLYNKVCQANVILTRRLVPGRLHDFAVRVKDSKGDSNSMQATVSVTNATTPRDTIFPHIPSLIMVPEDTKPGKELDYLLVRANPWSGKPVYVELWQPKELFTIRQRQTPAQTRGIITLIGELDFETQSMYTLTMYATDPYTEPGKDTRNIAGLHVVVIVQDVQDVPPVFTLAPPLTRLNNSVQPGDVILRVHAEDGDKGAPREVTYGLVSEGNPFTPFFNISETTGEIILARPLEELTQITHVGAPVVLSIVAEEIRRSREEPPAQATVVDVGLLLGEPGNSPPYFENESYVAWMEENTDPGTTVMFTEPYSTRVRDEDVGKAGVFTLKLGNNNGTFEVTPTVAERTANFIITVRDNALIDYELHKSLQFMIIAQEVGPTTNLSASVPVTIFLRDVNDNPPEFEQAAYEVTLSENVTAGTRVLQVHATDKDTGLFGSVQYTRITGLGSEALAIDPDTGVITIAMGTKGLDREAAPNLRLSVEARDEDGRGLRTTVPLIINLIDVNDNAPVFEKDSYEFSLNPDLTNFTVPAIIKAVDADAEPPNNEVRYELVHGNYENKFYLDEITGEIILREPLSKARRARHNNAYQHFAEKFKKGFLQVQKTFQKMLSTTEKPLTTQISMLIHNKNRTRRQVEKIWKNRKKRADEDALYTLTARAYDLGVPHLSSLTRVRIVSGSGAAARTVMFVVPGEHPDPKRTAETLAAITGGRVTIQEIRPYNAQSQPNGSSGSGAVQPSIEVGKKSVVVARVEQNGPGNALVDIEKIRESLAASGVGIIGGMETQTNTNSNVGSGLNTNSGGEGNVNAGGHVNTDTTVINKTVTTVHSEEVTVYKAENKLLFWLLILLGLLMLLAALVSILCCICPGCPFYMAPRKRRVHSSETLIVRSDGRPKKHLHRKQTKAVQVWSGKKQAWSADPTRRNWQFNRRNIKNPGLASLPGDVVYIQNQEVQALPNAASLRLRDGPAPIYIRDPAQRHEEERIYIEDVEGQAGRIYDLGDVDSLRRHELERGSDIPRQGYRYTDHRLPEDVSKLRREQLFYRDGNAEVLRLVSRGHLGGDELLQSQRPTTLVIGSQSHTYRNDGKDILLRRFIEDQKIRHHQDMHDSMQGNKVDSLESLLHRREAMTQQHEILLIPERLEREHRQHVEEMTPGVQRLIIDYRDSDEKQRVDLEESKIRETQRHHQSDALSMAGAAMVVGEVISKATEKPMVANMDQTALPLNVPSYTMHDIELARQNALLTKLLLERDSRGVGGVALDASSYLETQSLPGQVAIATQTDCTAATQTEHYVQARSRSDNDESEDEIRLKKRYKSKKRYGDGDLKRANGVWLRSPIREESRSFSEKRTSILRRKAKEAREGRKSTLETEVLREISDSLDDHASSPLGDQEQQTITYRHVSKETRHRHRVRDDEKEEQHRGNESPSSPEIKKDKYHRASHENESERGEVEEPRTESSLEKQDNTEQPSFRVIEKKIGSLRKQVGKLKDNKLQESNRSENTLQDKRKSTEAMREQEILVTDNDNGIDSKKKNTEKKKYKRTDGRSKVVAEQVSSKNISVEKMDKQREQEEPPTAKTRKVLKYQKSKKISTGSSEYEDPFDKPRQQSSKTNQSLVRKHQQSTASGQVKLRNESKDERAIRKPMLTHQRGIEKSTEGSTDEPPKQDPDRAEHKNVRKSTHRDSKKNIKNNTADKAIKSNIDHEKFKQDSSSTQEPANKNSTHDFSEKSPKPNLDRQERETLSSTQQDAIKKDTESSAEDESSTRNPDRPHTGKKELSDGESRRSIGIEVLKTFLNHEISESLQNIQRHPEMGETSSHSEIKSAAPHEAQDKKEENVAVSDRSLSNDMTDPTETQSSESLHREPNDNERVSHFEDIRSESLNNCNDQDVGRENRPKQIENMYLLQSKSTHGPPMRTQIIKQSKSGDNADQYGQPSTNLATTSLQSENKSNTSTMNSNEQDHPNITEEDDGAEVQSNPQEEDNNKDSRNANLIDPLSSTDHISEISSTQVLDRMQNQSAISQVISEQSNEQPHALDEPAATTCQSNVAGNHGDDVNVKSESPKETVRTDGDNGIQKSDSQSSNVLSDRLSSDNKASGQEIAESTKSPIQMTSQPTVKVDSDELQKVDRDMIPPTQLVHQEIEPMRKDNSSEPVGKLAEEGTFVELQKEVKHPARSTENLELPTLNIAFPHSAETVGRTIGSNQEKGQTPYESSSSSDSSNETMLNAQPYQTPRHGPKNLSQNGYVDSEVIDKVKDMDSPSPERMDSMQNLSSRTENSINKPLQSVPGKAIVSEGNRKENEYVYSEAIDKVKDMDSPWISPERMDSIKNLDSRTESPIDKPLQSLPEKARVSKGNGPFQGEVLKSISRGDKTTSEKDDHSIETKNEEQHHTFTPKLEHTREKQDDQKTESTINGGKGDDSKEAKRIIKESNVQQETSTFPSHIQDKIHIVRHPSSEQYKGNKEVARNTRTITRHTDSNKATEDRNEQVRSIPQKKRKDSFSEEEAESENQPGKKVAVPHKDHTQRSRLRDIGRSQRTNENLQEQPERRNNSDQSKVSKKKEERHDKKPSQQYKPQVEESKESTSSGSGAKTSSPGRTNEEGVKDSSNNKPTARYMSWYKQKRQEMERKRRERKEAAEEEQRPRWMRKSSRLKIPKEAQVDKRTESKTPQAMTPRTKRKIKPLVNVESEQLRAIVRQGRQMRKAEGGNNADLPVQIFAPEKPPPLPSPPPVVHGPKYHPLVQHSEYKYEKIPPPFYLHPPPVPHSSPQISPEHTLEGRRPDDDLDSGIAVSLQGGSRLRHQQLLEKKSVFDIAYNEAAPSHLRADSTTPPS